MHTISTFSNRLVMMINGFHREFENTAAGIKAYQRLCMKNDNQDIEKICSGNDSIKFYNVEINTKVLQPGDSFQAKLMYDADVDYLDVEVDIAILTNREISFHFQATNKAYNKIIDLKKENKSLHIAIKEIRVNNAIGKINIAVWSRNREVLLFWWRIPVEFLGVDHSIGNSFLDVSYKIQ